MFRLESYITPIIWSYFSKYVKNFNSHDFQVSLWNGGAIFSNLELNLDVLDSELQIPLSFVSGHIQELRITVPWRKITSEPIVLNVNSMELVLKHRETNDDLKRKKADEVTQPSGPPQDENSGYMRSLITKIVSNVRVNFENVVIKYIESDIAFSVNVGEASMGAADENWKTVFLSRIAYSPDFILRKKLSFSDVNICLDRCNNAGLVDKFQDPMLYRCDFDVRIVQKFATSFSRVPYFYRMDLFLGHLQFCVTDEQIPMLVRLYNLFSWLMESGTIDNQNNETQPSAADEHAESKSETRIDIEGNSDAERNERDHVQSEVISSDADNSSWTYWATEWLFNLPVAVFGEEDEGELAGEDQDLSELSTIRNSEEKPAPDPDLAVIAVPEPEEKEEGLKLPPPTTHFGVYFKTLTIIFKAVKRVCDRPSLQRKIISIYPFLKCSIQGVVCDFIVRGNENSHTLGVSSIMVDGLGYCPCGVQDCSSSEVALPTQGGECYFEAGKINSEFSALSFFQSSEESPPEWCYDVEYRSFLQYDEESKMLEKTPAFFLRYIVMRNETTMTEQSKNNFQQQNPEISEIIYQGVAAPCKILVCSGLLHRLKMIFEAINNYGYEPYAPVNRYELGVVSSPFLKLGTPLPSSSTSKFEPKNIGLKQPVTTYRLVIRQPLIEIFAADHPSDYSPEKRAEYFRRSGGIVPPIVLPRLAPEWPRMVISWDVLECTAEDTDGHFSRLRALALHQVSYESSVKPKRSDVSEEHNKWMNEELPRTAFVNMRIAEVLFTFISEPMELNLGIKTGSLQLTFVNRHLYELIKILYQVDGSVFLESVTCSSRLERRSNVLWLPFSMGIQSTIYLQPNLLSQPSITCTIDSTPLNIFIGPETVITLSNLITKLFIHLEEFFPLLSNTQDCGSTNAANHQLVPKFSDHFKTRTLPVFDSCSHPCNHEADVGICSATKSLYWRYPQKRTIHCLKISTVLLSLHQKYLNEVKFEVEYFQESVSHYYYYCGFKLSEGMSVTQLPCGSLEQRVITSTMWRIRIASSGVKSDEILPLLAKGTVIESVHIPELSVKAKFSEVLLNLVNSTFYSGKQVTQSALQPYGNTDGVCPADHILAAFHFKDSHIFYKAIAGISKFNVDLSMEVKVLDYESVVLEPVVDSVVVGFELLIPDSSNPYSLNLATDNISLKIGASVIHSIMYSAAVWNQIISSFDMQSFKMTSNENQSNIILNRVLVSNDLFKDVKIRSSDPESFGAVTISNKDCKAISFPSRSGSFKGEKKLFLSIESTNEIKIDLQKSGYTPYKLDGDTIFVKVSNLSTSQKLVNISGPIVIVNGLDRAVEVSLVLHTSTTVEKMILPSRGTGPMLLFPFDAIEHFRFRFVSSQSQQPWSEVIDAVLLTEDQPQDQSFTLVNMLSHCNDFLSETKVWLTRVTEEISGSERHMIALSPVYCLRSWLCSDTLVHLSSMENKNAEIYAVHGKGREVEIRAHADCGDSYEMKFQSSPKVPPSGEVVRMASISPSMCKKARPIDELLAKLTTGVNSTSLDQDDTSKWPFIDEDIPLNEKLHTINK